MKDKLIWLVACGGVLFGLLLFAGLRFVSYRDQSVHFHANFAVYINGQREAFAGPGYYEEATSCDEESSSNPLHRTHMHGQVNDVVHVHAAGVTWGQFFENLGWSISNTQVSSPLQTFANSTQANVVYILNGKTVDYIANRVIGDQDRLLVNYGDQSTEQINQEFANVNQTAKQMDQDTDPASCGGASSNGWRARLHHIWD